MISGLLLAGILTAVLTALGAILLTWLLRRLGAVAVPNARSSHSQPTVVGVGIVVPIAVSAATLALTGQLVWPLICAVAISMLGFVDDALDLPAPLRLGLQFALALGAVLTVGASAWWVVLLATAALVAAVNGLNFIDGINGITASQGIVFGIAMAVAASALDSRDLVVVGLLVVAACVGYLPNNYPQAQSFPGDGLPYFLGAIMVLGAIDLTFDPVGTRPVALLAMAPMAPAFVDTLSTAVRRARAGESLFTPHRDHAYQRLSRRTSHTVATLVFVALSAQATASVFVGVRWGFWAGGAALAVGLLISAGVLLRVPQDWA